MTQSLHSQQELDNDSWLDGLVPNAGKINIDEFEQILNESKSRGILIRPVFDINQTLGIFTSEHGEFYPEVLREFVLLLSKVPVRCISGDQQDIIRKQFLPILREYVEDQKLSKDEKSLIFKNLTIYAQTGVCKLTLNEVGQEKVFTQNYAKLTDSEFDIIRNKIIPIIINEYSTNPIYEELIQAGFKSPCSSSYETKEKKDCPLFTQSPLNNTKESIELSIFGIHTDPKVKRSIKEIIISKPKAQELIDKILNKCNELLNEYINTDLPKSKLLVKAQKGGTSTVDFRRGSKDIVMFLEIGANIDWIEPILVVGIGDSFGKDGNDSSLENVASLVFDVSQNNQNAKNILDILKTLKNTISENSHK